MMFVDFVKSEKPVGWKCLQFKVFGFWPLWI